MENISPQDIESIHVLKDASAIKKYGEKGKRGVIEIQTKPKIASVNFAQTDSKTIASFPDHVLIIKDGKEISNKETKNIAPNSIRSINVLKGEAAIKKYGEKAKDGAIEISTKYNIPENTSVIIDGKKSTREDLEKIEPGNIESITILKDDSSAMKYGMPPRDVIKVKSKKNLSGVSLKDTVPDKIFTKVEVEASFPGGLQAWIKYISKAIRDSIDKFTNRDYGTCVIRFIVNVDGNISEVIATTMKGSELAKVSVDAIKNGPKWIPASQNGKPVAAYRLQPVTLQQPKEVKQPRAENKSTTEISSGNDRTIFTRADHRTLSSR